MLRRDDVRAYVSRDWERVSLADDTYWRSRKRRLGLAEILRVMDDLRAHAEALHPGWPTEGEREEDLQTHQRIAEAIAKVRRK